MSVVIYIKFMQHIKISAMDLSIYVYGSSGYLCHFLMFRSYIYISIYILYIYIYIYLIYIHHLLALRKWTLALLSVDLGMHTSTYDFAKKERQFWDVIFCELLYGLVLHIWGRAATLLTWYDSGSSLTLYR